MAEQIKEREEMMSDRLTRLIDGFVFGSQIAVNSIEWNSATVKELADYLIANGVIVPPCKEGDSLFMLNRDKTKVQEMIFEEPDIRCHCKKDDEFACCMPICTSYQNGICAYRFNNDFREIGKTVFLSREEAEKARKCNEF